MLIRRARPARAEIDRAALELLDRHGAQILATARRYAATPEDAEDAYQRGLEILLTKAPTTSEADLVPWLKTVVKHEAFALRRHRERHAPVTDDGEVGDRGAVAAATHDQAERYEDLRQGAEALGQLKPQEIRALLLRAEGYSYAEICEITGWTYTKVNRCLTEGRQALSVRLAGIQGGIECAKLAPLLSALADGEASAEQVARLRPHMKTCLACRATLREFRAAPARVATWAPPAALLAPDPGGGPLRSLFESIAGAAQQKAESIAGAAQQKAAVLGERAGAAAELATGQKIAALAASAAAVAGGGTAVDHLANHQGPPLPPAQTIEQVETKPVKDEVVMGPPPATPPPAPAPASPPPALEPSAPAPAAPTPAPEPPPPPPPPPPDPANEFAPGGASAASASPAAAPQPAPATAPHAAPAPAPARPAPAPPGSGGSSEFAP
ncbi:MAG TPA: sigma-70 family RNA polymerase sigma factor [Thermoleophilaceae bacterium]|nr:sigma-70 family RNA polymerase sigma factor [Thermoleophilaceae bacterium]